MSTPPLPEWCKTAPDAAFSAQGDCAQLASAFERRIRWRNMAEYAAGFLVFVLFSGSAIGAFWKGEILIGLSMALTVAGIVVVMRWLNIRASNVVRRPEDPCIVHLRRQYQRQHDALSEVPKWYLGPLVPGMVMFFAVVTAKTADQNGWAMALSALITPAAFTIAIFGGVAVLNWWGARSLKKKLASLDGLA